MKRIAITGLGMHTAFGDGEATARALAEGKSAVTFDHPFASGRPPFPAAPAPDPAPTEFLTDRKSIKYMGPCTQMAVLAAGRALKDAGLTGETAAGLRGSMGLYMATGPIAFDVEGTLQTIGKDGIADLLDQRQAGLRLCHPLLPFKMLLNMPLGLTSITFGIRGPNAIFYPGADQGAVALWHALRALRAGRVARAVAGGSAHTLALSPLLALERLGTLGVPDGDGLAPADQAAMLVLETEDAARARKARIHAFLDDVTVTGPGADGDPSRGFPTRPDRVLVTGTRRSRERDLAKIRAAWPGVHTDSLDDCLGVAPAASLPLAAAVHALTGKGRALVCFQDERAAARVRLSPSEAA